jgi:hypothetical protein
MYFFFEQNILLLLLLLLLLIYSVFVVWMHILFFTEFTRSHHYSLPWNRQIQSEISTLTCEVDFIILFPFVPKSSITFSLKTHRLRHVGVYLLSHVQSCCYSFVLSSWQYLATINVTKLCKRSFVKPPAF